MKKLFTTILAVFMISQLNAQLVAWNLFGKPGNQETSNSTITNNNLETAVLSRGLGITAQAATNSYASTFLVNVDSAAARIANSYYEFTISPKGNAIINLSTLDVILRIQTNAPRTYIWRYSKNNGTSFTDIGTPIAWTTDFTNNNGVPHPQINLSGITDLQNINSPIIFRLYAWGGSSTTSDNGFRIGKSLTSTQNALAIGGTVVQENTLPVTLTSFTGKYDGNVVKLNWVTASEKNNSHFDVLRSSEGKPSEVIGTVTGSGNSSSATSYNFTDYSPLAANNYYQLRQVDANGDTEESTVIHVNTGLSASALKVYHSKEDNHIELSVYSVTGGSGRVLISDMQGHKLQEISLNFQKGYNNLTLPGLGSGVFVATFVTAREQLSAKFSK